jgi:hypothetical protein
LSVVASLLKPWIRRESREHSGFDQVINLDVNAFSSDQRHTLPDARYVCRLRDIRIKPTLLYEQLAGHEI